MKTIRVFYLIFSMIALFSCNRSDDIHIQGEFVDELKDYSDYILPVPSNMTPCIQESHIMIGHIICHLVEKTLFGDKAWETEQSLLTETAQ